MYLFKIFVEIKTKDLDSENLGRTGLTFEEFKNFSDFITQINVFLCEGEYAEFQKDKTYFYPQLLSSEMSKIVKIEGMNLSSLWDLIKKSEKIVLEINDNLKSKIKSSHFLRIYKIRDYGKIIDILEEKKMVNVRDSRQFLSTDGRVFTFENKECISEKFRNQEYEVDCIGTKIHENLTIEVERLLSLSTSDL